MPDGTIIGQVNDELDEFEEKQGLLSFDKFNVASSSTTTDLDITAALTEELNKQIELYEQIKNSMGEIQNEAIQIAQKIKDWVVVLDEEGKFKDLTSQAKGLLSIVAILITIPIVAKIKDILSSTEKLTISIKLLKQVFTPTGLIISSIAAVLIYMYSVNENFRNSVNKLLTVLLSLIGTALQPLINLIKILTPTITKIINISADVLAFIVNIISEIITFAEKLHILDGLLYIIIGALTLFGTALLTIKIVSFINNIKKLSNAIITFGKNMIKFMISPSGLAIAAIVLLVSNIGMLIHGWDDMSGWQKAVGIIGAVAGAIMLVVSAIAAFHGTWTLGTAIAAITAGLVAAGSAIALFWSNAKKEASKTIEFSGAYANGGTPRTGSLFYANERGAELLTNFGGQNYVNTQQQVEEMLFRANLRAKQMSNELGGGQEVNVKVAFDINGNALARDLNPYIKTENARGGNR